MTGAPAGLDPAVRRPFLADGVLSRLMDACTGGAFLAGLALWSGADAVTLGLVAALPMLAQVAQVAALALLLRVRDRRAVVLVCAGTGRGLLALLALALLLRPAWVAPASLVGLLAVVALLTVVATAAWNWWMRDLLPPDRLGRLFADRTRRTTLVALAATLAAGLALDALRGAGQEAAGYGLLFAVGAASGLLALLYLARTPHVAPPPSPPASASLRQLLDATRAPATRPALLALALLAVAVAVSLPFVAVHLLRDAGLGFAAIAVLAALSQLGVVAGLRGWGHLADRHGERGALLVACALLALLLAGWAATAAAGGAARLALLAFLHFGTGFALGGLDLAGTSLLLRSAPAHGAQAHLAAIGLAKAVVAGLATLAAGWAWGALGTGPVATVPLPWGAAPLGAFHLLSLAAAVLALAALAAVARLPEPRPRPFVEVTRAMRREVAEMSSVAGIRAFIHAVSYSVEFLARPFAARPPPPPPRRPQPFGDD
jgi:predicted MFS family arabinose efflux permease